MRNRDASDPTHRTVASSPRTHRHPRVGRVRVFYHSSFCPACVITWGRILVQCRRSPSGRSSSVFPPRQLPASGELRFWYQQSEKSSPLRIQWRNPGWVSVTTCECLRIVSVRHGRHVGPTATFFMPTLMSCRGQNKSCRQAGGRGPSSCTIDLLSSQPFSRIRCDSKSLANGCM